MVCVDCINLARRVSDLEARLHRLEGIVKNHVELIGENAHEI
jgi:hypothetical protein